MIGYLKGVVRRNTGKAILLDVHDVGYELIIPAGTAVVCAVKSTVELFTYLHVREDDLSLFGFESEEQLQFFKLLLSVSGIGPKMGIEILSLPIHQVQQAIVEEDKAYLRSIKGLGDKIASRLLLELKNKIKLETIEEHRGGKINLDVVEALERLGYDRNRVIKLLKSMEQPIEDEQELMKYCLQNL